MRPFRLALCFSFLVPTLTLAQAGKDRAELGQRLGALERALAKTNDAEVRKRALVPMKSLTFVFFSGQLGKAAKMLDEARLTLEQAKNREAKLWAASLSIQAEHALLDAKATSLTCVVKPYYKSMTKTPKGARLRLSLLPIDGGKSVCSDTTKLGELPTEAKLTWKTLAPGDYRLRTEVLDGSEVLLSRQRTVSLVKDRDTRLDALTKKFAKFEKEDTVEYGTLRHLLDLLGDLKQGKILEMNYPGHRLVGDAESLVKAIEERKPYLDPKKPGQHWLYLPTRRGSIVRLQVPRAAKAGKPMPLVIALHGAGGSENLFFEGYGNGLVAKLCEERGWLLVAPRNGVSTDLVQQIAAIYPVDKRCVFLVGHSMGAAQAVSEGCRKPSAYTGVAALGGTGTVGKSDELQTLPFFVGVGSEDFALAGARVLGRNLKRAGVKRVESKEYANVEHLTVVQIALPEVFEFFDSIANSPQAR